MTDQSAKVPNIAELARKMEVEYTHLYLVLHGKKSCSVAYAKEIQQATNGEIAWTSFFEDQPSHSFRTRKAS